MTNDPFADPAVSVGIDYDSLAGCLLMFEVLSVEANVPSKFSIPGIPSPAIRVNLTILDGPEGGRHLEDSLVFPKVLQSQLRPRVGKIVLGRLGKGEARQGQNPPWRLDPATDADKDLARRYVQGQGGQQAQPQGQGWQPQGQPQQGAQQGLWGQQGQGQGQAPQQSAPPF